MEEKKTGKGGRCLGVLLSMLLLAALAGGIVFAYPRMMQEADEIYTEYLEKERQKEADKYLNAVYPLVYGMYVDWYKATCSEDKSAGEILLGNLQGDMLEEDNYVDWYIEREKKLNKWYYTYEDELETYQVQFYIYRDGVPQEGVGTILPEEIYGNKEQYPLLLLLQFDQNGAPRVVEQCGVSDIQHLADSEYVSWTKDNRCLVNVQERIYAEHGYHALSNMTVLIARDNRMFEEMDKTFGYTYEVINESIYAMSTDYFIFVAAGVTVVLLLGLLLPFVRAFGLKEGWKANLPLEFVGGIVTFIVVFLADVVPEFILKCQIELQYPGTVFYWLGVMEDIVADGRESYLLYAVNGMMWFAVFFALFMCVLSVRQVFSKGILRYVKENTLFGIVCCFIGRLIKKFFSKVGTIDFKEKGNKTLVKILVANFVLVAGISCTWIIGIFLAIPYTILLFWLLQKRWKDIRTQYELLLMTTEEMSQGRTAVEYIGDGGVFHELKDALQGVQIGFHKAVQEEVKSQRMKTELITNVSHDLKTPLTAIITYVDLLKNEELTGEERQGYVKVLEQKSARLKTLIEDLFEVSKATSGDIQMDMVDLDLVQLLQEVQLELEEEIMNSGIEFKVNLPEEKVMVHLDGQKTCRIFENLMVNIMKHGLTGSRAYIQMEQTKEKVSVILKNISAVEMNFDSEEIMERFTRGDASRNTEGSGLGLAIVKSFAEAQGGSVKLELDGDLFKAIVTFRKTERKEEADTLHLE